EKGNRYRIVPLETSDFQDLYLCKKS
ncbi:MAG TPA: helicase, partial [Paraprevotella xylaniphila]|nr:helicase [Paraprevotella xylaniphila]